jgi:heme/copper-type cytochrome/quinol oxidase subunit 1
MIFYNSVDFNIREVLFYWIFFGVNLIFFPIHYSGIHGIPRRYFAYDVSIGYVNNLCLLGILISRLSWIRVCVVMLCSRAEGVGLGSYGLVSEMAHGMNLQPHTFMASL